MNKKICVFGSYKSLGKKKKEDTVQLGALLAESGFTVVNGGFGGTMEDVAKGAKKAGGKTIGVTYYKYSDTEKKANKYIDEEIRTENIFERINVMLKQADGFVVLPGGTGTLLEFAAILEHVKKGLMNPKPIVALGDYWSRVVDALSTCRDLVTFVETPEEVIFAISAR